MGPPPRRPRGYRPAAAHALCSGWALLRVGPSGGETGYLYIYIYTRLHWRFAPCTLILRASHNLVFRAIVFGLEVRPATPGWRLDPNLGVWRRQCQRP